MIGYDYTERIAPAALIAAGCSVVIRYTTWSGWAKSLTPGEADELHAAGIPIVANFESTATRMKAGAVAGRADALEARGHLGDDHLPTSLKVWFSADWDVQPSEVAAVLAYLNAAAAALGGKQFVGCYGGLRAVKAAADAGFSIWQTVAWSGGVWDSRAVARQTGAEKTIGGGAVDVDEIEDLTGLGAWMPPSTAPTSTPTPSTPSEDAVAFAEGRINPGSANADATVIAIPPANSGAAGWGNVWFSLASDFGDAHVRVALYVHGVGWTDFKEDFMVPSDSDRVQPFGNALPDNVQKVSVKRLVGSENIPLAYLIEAVQR